ncbi:MAG: hypothetical protein B7Y45_12670 [Sphingomonas sp. 28-66-16]|nr:MAG: hypothetical protein B7Y45_12670 [Sphingomonas sp. 28-66-16]
MHLSPQFGLFVGLSSIALMAAPAMAQDAPAKEFEGVYVGASVGFDAQPNDVGESILFDRNLDGRFGDVVTTAAGANAFSPGFCNGAARTNAPDGGCANDRDGLSYSGRIGGDAQFGHLVIGAIGEFGKSDVRDSVTAYSTTPASYTMTRGVDFDANLRARVGYAANRTLFYATGGGAYAKINHSFTTTNGANSFAVRGKDDRFGYVVGGGLEQKISRHVSFGLEYLYNQFKDGDSRVRAGQGTAPLTNPFLLATTQGTDFARSDSKFAWHSVKLTLNYRF